MPYTSKYGPPIFSSRGSAPSYYTYLAKPDAVKRLKPTILDYTASTDRAVSSYVETRGVYRYSTYEPGTAILYVGVESDPAFHYALEKAKSKLLSTIKNQNVNLAVAMAEFRKACTQFLSLARELYQGYKAIRRGHLVDLGRDIRRNRSFSQKWIEYQFGLLPFALDLKGICDSLADSLQHGLTLHAKASHGAEGRYERVLTSPDGNVKIFHDEYWRANYRLTCQYVIRDANLKKVQEFGFTNALSFGWELVPFSCVADYVLDIGGWLENLDALVGTENLVYIVGYALEHSATRTGQLGGQAVATVRVRGRSAAQSDLRPPFPRYDPSASLKKVANGIALLRLLSR